MWGNKSSKKEPVVFRRKDEQTSDGVNDCVFGLNKQTPHVSLDENKTKDETVNKSSIGDQDVRVHAQDVHHEIADTVDLPKDVETTFCKNVGGGSVSGNKKSYQGYVVEIPSDGEGGCDQQAIVPYSLTMVMKHLNLKRHLEENGEAVEWRVRRKISGEVQLGSRKVKNGRRKYQVKRKKVVGRKAEENSGLECQGTLIEVTIEPYLQVLKGCGG